MFDPLRLLALHDVLADLDLVVRLLRVRARRSARPESVELQTQAGALIQVGVL